MVGMQNMSAAVAPLRSEPAFIDMLTKFSNPFIGILIGLLVTAVLQSASATVGILQALSVTGAISFSVALPINGYCCRSCHACYHFFIWCDYRW